jgi:cysteine-rich repeat protein
MNPVRFAALALVGTTACLDTSVAFECRSSLQCVQGGQQGTCEPTGACSFPDTSCASHRRYGPYADPVIAGRCASCGNGVRDPGEDCDDGNDSNEDACLSSCRFNVCGDGYVRTGVEECDDRNKKSGDACSSVCLLCASGQASFTWETNKHCYSRYDGKLAWDDAERTCERDSSHLVVYSSDPEVNAVATGLLANATAWIGLHDETRPPSGAYAWVTDEPLNRYIAGFRNSPAARTPGSCVTQLGSQPWVGASCTTPQRFVCEAEPWVLRPTDNHAYRVFYEKVSFARARELCATIGAHLATLTDPEEDAFVTAQFYGVYWIGAVRDATNPSFQWVSGERFVYANLLPGEPNMPGPACLIVGDDHKWRDRACTDLNPFVCEHD